MNRKIPFHELASLLAANCNISSEEAEEFIKSFFDLTTQALSEGESLRIKGIGAFELSDDKDDPIIFTPDETIAETINAPFALLSRKRYVTTYRKKLLLKSWRTEPREQLPNPNLSHRLKAPPSHLKKQWWKQLRLTIL